jgi:hypothetical protein
MAVSVFSVLIFGTAPSLEATWVDLAPSLKEVGARAGAGLRRLWMRRVFLVVQTSIALALVATAAVTFKAGRALHRVDPGFRTANLVLVDLKPAAWRYTTTWQRGVTFSKRCTGCASCLKWGVWAS